MPSMRVHELAKELNRQAKDIMAYLEKEGVPVTSHMNTLDEKDVQKVRAHFSAKPDKNTSGDKNASADAEKKEDGQKNAKRPRKKASISAVFNPQNSKNGNRRQKSVIHDADNQKKRHEKPKKTTKTASQGARNTGKKGNRHPGPSMAEAQRAQRYAAAKAAEEAKLAAEREKAEQERRRKELEEQKQKEAELAARREREAAAKAAEEARAQEKAKKAAAEEKQQKDSRKDSVKTSSRGGRNEQQDRNRRDTRRTEERSGGRRDGERKEKSVQKGYQNSRSASGSRTGARSGGKDHQSFAKDARQGRSGKGGGLNAASPENNKDSRRNDRNKTRKKDYDKKNNRKQERYVNLEKKTGFKKRNAAPKTMEEKKEREEVREIKLPEYMTVHELADKMKISPSEIIKKLFLQGTVLTMNQEIDYEKAEAIALEFNCIAEPEEKVDVIAELLKEDEEDPKDMVPRPPVVCVMGHVDHGKTSLLDRIRKTHVTDREAGGITQHIGASVATINGRKITFLDTPGHEAFTAMRMRGANSTDIAILVVAADDGIMPQTIEAINHAKAAGIEIIVAINKIDKPNANIEKVKEGLAEQGLIPEDWGGSTICVPVSAKTGEGIDDLLEMVLLTADMLELKANPNRKARGIVIEAKLDKGRGAVATVLVQKGTLHSGDPVAAGSSYGKVRAMSDHTGKRVKEAGPSTPVEIFGLSNVPEAGEVLMAFDNEKEARNFAEAFVSKDKERLLDETRARLNLDDIFSQIQAGNLKELDLIVKADVQGSVEAVKQSLEKLSNDEVVVKVIHGAVGNISESDVNLASASNAIIIGFNVKPDSTAKSIADHENVDIHLYSVIYKAIEDVENAIKGMLEPIYEEKVTGHAEVRQLFKASGVGTIAGSYVLDGVIERDSKVRISRDDKQIFEGSLASLKRFKDDVKEVKAGYECGLVVNGFNDLAEGDQVEAYKMVEVPRQ